MIDDFQNFEVKFSLWASTLQAVNYHRAAVLYLYIIVSDSFENALYHAVRAENWFVYGIAVLENYADYAAKKEAEKKRVVFDLIKQGLNDITKIDKLDIEILNEVLDELNQSI